MTRPSIDAGASPDELLNQLAAAVARQDALFNGDALVLYAGSNIPPREARSLHVPSLSAMPAMGRPDNKEQPGSDTVAALETALAETVCAIFGAAWADARLQSCSIANLATFLAFGERGLLLAPSPSDGGHFSQVGGGTPDLAGLSTVDLPFDAQRQTLDTHGTVQLVHKTRPQLVILGRSVMLGPDDIAPVVEAARAVGARTIYDASHVAGLIAGGVFPNPIALGIDLMTMSTYKTLGGPPGAIVCGRHPADGETFASLLDRAFLANQDAARYPVLLASLQPFRSGTDEPRRIVENATAFKRELETQGLPVLLAGTPAASHQVVVPTGPLPGTLEAMRALENARILVGRCPNPGSPGGYGLRFGVQYATRIGLGPLEMSAAAKIIARRLRPNGATACLAPLQEADSASVGDAVRELVALFQTPQDTAP